MQVDCDGWKKIERSHLIERSVSFGGANELAAESDDDCVNEFALWKALDGCLGSVADVEPVLWAWKVDDEDEEPRPLADDVVAVATIVPRLRPPLV